jgi:hypothetical protein
MGVGVKVRVGDPFNTGVMVDVEISVPGPGYASPGNVGKAVPGPG